MRTFTNLFKIEKENKSLEIIEIGFSKIIIIDCNKVSYTDLINFWTIKEYFDGIMIFLGSLDELYYSDLDQFSNLIICFNLR